MGREGDRDKDKIETETDLEIRVEKLFGNDCCGFGNLMTNISSEKYRVSKTNVFHHQLSGEKGKISPKITQTFPRMQQRDSDRPHRRLRATFLSS